MRIHLAGRVLLVVVATGCTGSVGPAGPEGPTGPMGSDGTVTGSGAAGAVLTSDGNGNTEWLTNATLTDLAVTTGRIGVGTTTPQTKVDIATENGDDSMQIRRYTNNSSPVKVDFVKALGSIAAPAAVNVGTNIFSLIAYAFDGNAFQLAGVVTMQVDTGFATGVVPGKLQVFTADSAGVVRERLRVDSAGHWISPAQVAPALTSCGTGPTVNGTDAAGTVDVGTAAAGCTITFAAPYANAPHCSVSSRAGTQFSYTVSTTGIVVTGVLSSSAIDFTCIGS